MMMHNYLGDNLFDEDWADTPLMREYFGKGNFLYGKHAKHLLRTDVRETEDAIEADIDLPGFKKDEIQVHLENGYLTVSAEKHADKQAGKGKYLRHRFIRFCCFQILYFCIDEGVDSKTFCTKTSFLFCHINSTPFP